MIDRAKNYKNGNNDLRSFLIILTVNNMKWNDKRDGDEIIKNEKKSYIYNIIYLL